MSSAATGCLLLQSLALRLSFDCVSDLLRHHILAEQHVVNALRVTAIRYERPTLFSAAASEVCSQLFAPKRLDYGVTENSVPQPELYLQPPPPDAVLP